MKSKILLLIVSILIFLFDTSYSSDKFLYLELLITKNEDLKVVANYILDSGTEEYLNNGNIKIVCYDSSNNILKTVYLNYSKEDFIQEVFSIKKGKEIIEKDSIIKSVIFKLPENVSTIKIFLNEKEKIKLILENQTLRIFEETSKQNQTETPRYINNTQNSNYLILIFISLFIILILTIVLFKMLKRRRAP